MNIFKPASNSLFALCFVVLLYLLTMCPGCGAKTENVTSKQSYSADSLLVLKLLKKGEVIYGARSSMEGIGESLLYFDSAHKLARHLGDTLLQANTFYFIGNVYNAWNGEPLKTLYYYERSAALFATLPAQIEKQYYLRYIIAHGYDTEKANDSARSAQTIIAAMDDYSNLPQQVKDSLNFMTDFAWVASNINNYKLAANILKAVNLRPVNDPESNNYLDHYYLTQARIAIYTKGQSEVYMDSLVLALKKCTNRFDSGYYAANLATLNAKRGDYEKAFLYSKISRDVFSTSYNNDILSSLRMRVLHAELAAEREKERRTRDDIRLRNLFLYSTLVIALLLGVVLAVYRKRKLGEARVVQQQLFTQKLLQKDEETRRRIAMELHDGVNHDLLVLKNKIILNKEMQQAEIEHIIASIRYVSHNLYPALFEAVGLQASVEALCNSTTELGCFTSCNITYSKVLPAADALQLYRIIQEAIQNIMKHAKAEACLITITSKPGELFLQIKDNGRGFTPGLVADGSFGLETMRQRALALGAKFTLQSSAAGTILTITKNA